MKRTTIFIDESLERDLQALAERQGRSRAAVVRLALERYVKREKQKAELELGFVGIGHSGRSDIAERHEEYLWQDLGEEEPEAADGSIEQTAIKSDQPR
jgi:predicted transcriptional regulator